jgi:hypothetical protein
MFKKIEPYLTFLDFVKLERKGADIEAKLTEKEKEIQILRQRDTINTYAIANLSDQVMKLMLEVKQVKQMQNQVDA